MDLIEIEREHTATHGVPLHPPDIDKSDDEGSEFRLEDDSIDSTRRILSVVWHRGRLGVAFHDGNSGTLHFGEMAEEQDFSCLQLVKFQTEPTEIILGSNQTESFQRHVRKSVDEDGDDQNYNVRICKNYDFDYDSARLKIGQISITDTPATFTDSEKAQHINSLFDFEQKLMIRAVGGLLSHLLRSSDSSDSSVAFVSAKAFSLSGLLTLDATASKSLQIFHHPSMQRTKEVLSLYSIFHERARSSVGRQLIRFWFTRPILHLDTLNDRLSTVEFFLDPRNGALLKNLSSEVARIKNLPRILTRIRSSKSNVADLKHLNNSTGAMIRIRELLRTASVSFGARNTQMPDESVEESPQIPKVFAKIQHFFNSDLDEVENLLSTVIDFGSSKISNRCVIKPFVDNQLEQFKQVYENLEEYLTSVAAEEMSRLPQNCGVSALRYVYFPQIGYLVVLSKAQAFETAAQQLSLEFQFETQSYAYYKSSRARELDEYFGDVYALIVDRENRIVREVESVIVEKSDILVAATQVCAELDCLLAFAHVALEKKYTKPVLVDEPVIDIRGGRHPLQEMCVDIFIPNDTKLDDPQGGDGSRIQIVTGPNFSGKSVYAKQVALITFLAHLGSFVPAHSATIGLTDRIFTRIHSRETASVAQSSFMIDLSQIGVALRHATSRSLIIIDEFGKGTSPQEGTALLTSTLNRLASMGKECPRVICTTHFHEIVEMVPKASYGTMKVVVESHSLEVENESENQPPLPPVPVSAMGDGSDRDGGESGEVVFLYKIADGKCDDSLGSYCARAAGVPEAIVRRGVGVSNLLNKGLPVGRIDQKDVSETIKERISLVRSFVSLDIGDFGQVSEFLKNIR